MYAVFNTPKGLEACGREVLVPEELIIFLVPEM